MVRDGKKFRNLWITLSSLKLKDYVCVNSQPADLKQAVWMSHKTLFLVARGLHNYQLLADAKRLHVSKFFLLVQYISNILWKHSWQWSHVRIVQTKSRVFEESARHVVHSWQNTARILTARIQVMSSCGISSRYKIISAWPFMLKGTLPNLETGNNSKWKSYIQVTIKYLHQRQNLRKRYSMGYETWPCRVPFQSVWCYLLFRVTERFEFLPYRGITYVLKQWFPNCGTRTTSGTRRPSRWYARPCCSSTHKKNILFLLIGFCW